MEAKLQMRIQRYGWDKAAVFYEKFWQYQLKPAQDLMISMSGINTGEKILDVACGTGLISFEAVRMTGKDGLVKGTDISDKMIEFAQSVALSKNINNVSFERMAAEELNLESESFNLVLCALGLMYVVNPLESLKEFYRVLKKNGRAVSAVWGERNNCGWASIFPVVDSRVKTDVCPMFFQLGTKDNLKLIYELAGFKNIMTKKINTTLYYDSCEDACGAAFAGGPVAMAFSRFDDKTKKEANEEYLESIKKFKRGTGYEIPGEFVVTSGFK